MVLTINNMRMQISFNPRQLAEKWVSGTVLLGCVMITVCLVYLSYTADAIGDDWIDEKSTLFQEYGL